MPSSTAQQSAGRHSPGVSCLFDASPKSQKSSLVPRRVSPIIICMPPLDLSTPLSIGSKALRALLNAPLPPTSTRYRQRLLDVDARQGRAAAPPLQLHDITVTSRQHRMTQEEESREVGQDLVRSGELARSSEHESLGHQIQPWCKSFARETGRAHSSFLSSI